MVGPSIADAADDLLPGGPVNDTGKTPEPDVSAWQQRVGSRVVVRYRLPAGGRTDVVGLLAEIVRGPDGVPALVVHGRAGEVTVPVTAVEAGKVVPPRPSRAAAPHRALSIPDLEGVTSGHWLPADHGRLGDWLLRAAGGFTNRANSVLVSGDPGLATDEALDHVRRWYAARGLPARASVAGPLPDGWRTEPAQWQLELEGRGWQVLAGASAVVMTAATLPLCSGPQAPPGLTVDVAPRPDDQWLGLYRYRGQASPPHAVEVLTSAPECAFVSVRSGSSTVAVGRGSVGSAWLGVTAVEVAGDHRRRGLGRFVLAELARWGWARDARSTFLQTAEHNVAAQALYLSAGFEPHHRYDYLQAPS